MIFINRGQNDFTIRGSAGAAATTLDAQGVGRVFMIMGFNGLTIEGLTITGGDAPEFGDFAGGGVACHLSNDVWRDCVFEGNRAEQGGGLWCGGVSTLRLENCTFRNNRGVYGGAMLFVNSSTTQTITGCVIENNISDDRAGAIYGYNNALNIENTLIVDNRAAGNGGAFYLDIMHPSSMTQCTVSNNVGAGAAFFLVESPGFVIDRSIVAANGSAGFVGQGGGTVAISCSDVWGNVGGNGLPPGSVDSGGNMGADPLFCDAGGYSLDAASPCAPGNHPDGADCGLVGARGVECGQVRARVRSWGQLKSLYGR
jgi:hypothetical protein